MSSPLTTFYIVRHGQSRGNVNPTDSNPDPELTDEGRQQVQGAAQKLAELPFDLLVHSDYIRAVQTAEILNAERQLEMEMHQDLRERNFGSFYQRPKDEVQKMLAEFHQKLDEIGDDEYWNYRHAEDMETEQEALDRFTNALKRVAQKHQGKQLLVVGHGNLMRSLLIYLEFAHFRELPPMSFANAGYIAVKTDGKKFFLEEVVGATKRSL
jgi:probable phosphoglycerate mutase